MIIRYLDHAVTVTSPVAGLGMCDFSPGLVDIQIFPELVPHVDGRLHAPRPNPPIFKLMRCCKACEEGYVLR